MSALIEFLKGEGTDSKGRKLTEYHDKDDNWWERCHNHVQWAFPLPEESKAEPASPVATQSDYDVIAMDPVLKMRMVALLGRFVLFLDRTRGWRLPADHNHLRITRVLRCLCFCGLNDVAFDFCDYVKHEVGKVAGKQTIWYWDEALKRNPAWLK